MLLDDTGECSARKEGGRHVKIVVSFQEEMKWKEVSWIPFPTLPAFPQVALPSLAISSLNPVTSAPKAVMANP